jgi:tRNA acetyltransferase TAN1
VKPLIEDFNILATTTRGNERAMINEILYLLKEELGDSDARASKTKIRGLIVAKTTLDPCIAIEKLRAILVERPYEFRYALRILPIKQVVPTRLEDIKTLTLELAKRIGEEQSFRVTVEKRFTSLHSRDLIEAAAGDVERRVNLKNPDLILLIEVLGAFTGISLLKQSDILAVVKEKML